MALLLKLTMFRWLAPPGLLSWLLPVGVADNRSWKPLRDEEADMGKGNGVCLSARGGVIYCLAVEVIALEQVRMGGERAE